MVLWNYFEVEEVEVDRQVGNGAISLHFCNVSGDFSWHFIGVYGPQCREGRRILCEELLQHH